MSQKRITVKSLGGTETGQYLTAAFGPVGDMSAVVLWMEVIEQLSSLCVSLGPFFTWDILQGPGKEKEVITSGNVSFLYVLITERDNICLLIAITLKQRVFLF